MIENKILTQHVYERIRQMIADGALAPGERINRKELEETLGVSQTPINDALSRLAGERFIEQESRRGYYVKRISAEEMIHLFEYRAATEGMAARLCAESAAKEDREGLRAYFDDFRLPIPESSRPEYRQRDTAFHRRILELSGNPMLAEMNEAHGYMMKSYQKGLLRDPNETLQEHTDIVEAIVAGAPEEAQGAMNHHLLRTRDSLIREEKKSE
ncbi:MAG: GntR family transcriptional regulator [Alkalispirochaetaceae bacterium]